MLFFYHWFFFCGIQKGRKFQRPRTLVSTKHDSDFDNDKPFIESDWFNEMVPEAEQVQPSNTCPFIQWEALESVDLDVDENLWDSASNDDLSASANERYNLLYSDSSGTEIFLS